MRKFFTLFFVALFSLSMWADPATIQLHSNITNPSWATSEAFQVASGNATASITLKNVSAGTYNFGIKINSTWTSNGTYFRRSDGAVAKEISSGSGNCVFIADVTGDYTFTWTYGDGTLTITYPESGSLNDYTVYFKNTLGWENVYAYLYSSTTYGDKGVGEQAALVCGQMSKIGDGPYYQYEFKATEAYSKVCFTDESHGGSWEYFWQDNCSWSASGLDFANDVVLWIPNSTPSESKNSSTYYNTGTWSVYPPLTPAVTFSGVPTTVWSTRQVTFAATSENIANPAYTYYIKQGDGDYAVAANPYTFDAAGTYTAKVEVRANGEGDALASAELTITCTKYSLMQNDHSTKGSEIAVCTSEDGTNFTATWNCEATGTYYFYVTTNSASDASTKCDFLNGTNTLSDGVGVDAWLYDTSNYGHSYTLNAPRTGIYTFTLTLSHNSSANTFTCDFPSATALDEATDSKKAVKRIVNGQLVIEREGKMYNALGAEVK